MFGGAEVNYHQTYSARDWLSILRTPYPTQNLQRKYRTDLHIMPQSGIPLKSYYYRPQGRRKNNWKTEETLDRAVVTLETERIKGSNP